MVSGRYKVASSVLMVEWQGYS